MKECKLFYVQPDCEDFFEGYYVAGHSEAVVLAHLLPHVPYSIKQVEKEFSIFFIEDLLVEKEK